MLYTYVRMYAYVYIYTRMYVVNICFHKHTYIFNGLISPEDNGIPGLLSEKTHT